MKSVKGNKIEVLKKRPRSIKKVLPDRQPFQNYHCSVSHKPKTQQSITAAQKLPTYGRLIGFLQTGQAFFDQGTFQKE